MPRMPIWMAHGWNSSCLQVFCAYFVALDPYFLWDQYTPDDINTWCNGKYQEEFTYKEGSETRDWGTYFDYMIQAGIIYGAIHVLVILYCCVYKPIKGIDY
eukprot:1017394_1